MKRSGNFSMPTHKTIRVLVVDDYKAFADSLTRILNRERDIEVTGEAANCAEALAGLNNPT